MGIEKWRLEWQSAKIYEHPKSHRKGVYGRIIRFRDGEYSMNCGAVILHVPQEWAVQQHFRELQECS